MFGAALGCGAISAIVGALVYSNIPTRFTLGAVKPTIQYLSETKLKLIEPGKNILASKDIMVSEATFFCYIVLIIFYV